MPNRVRPAGRGSAARDRGDERPSCPQATGLRSGRQVLAGLHGPVGRPEMMRDALGLAGQYRSVSTDLAASAVAVVSGAPSAALRGSSVKDLVNFSELSLHRINTTKKVITIMVPLRGPGVDPDGVRVPNDDTYLYLAVSHLWVSDGVASLGPLYPGRPGEPAAIRITARSA